MSAPAVSERGSSATGHCSNVSDSGRVGNASRSSILFDGIPTLTRLEGNMWASQLLTLNTSTSSASTTFGFTNATNYGNEPVEVYTGESVVEVVMFHCPAKEIGTNNVKLSANGNAFGNIVVPESCEHLERGCRAALFSSSQAITPCFSKTNPNLYIAKIMFYNNFECICSPFGSLDTSVEGTSEQTSTTLSNQESSSNRLTDPLTLSSKTLEIKDTTIKQYFTTILEQNSSTNNNPHIPSNSIAIFKQG